MRFDVRLMCGFMCAGNERLRNERFRNELRVAACVSVHTTLVMFISATKKQLVLQTVLFFYTVHAEVWRSDAESILMSIC